MKIASYNIMSGGFSSYSEHIPKPERLPRIIDVVKGLDADFVALIDTYRWEAQFSASWLCESFGYVFARSISLDDERLIGIGHNNGITILSRKKPVRTDIVRLSNRNAILATLAVSGREVDIISMYLDDKSEGVRVEQIRSLAGHLGKNPTVLMGDFNTVDPGEATGNLTAVFPMFLKHPLLKVEVWPRLMQMLRGAVVPELVKNGFTDAGKGSDPTAPTPLAQLPTDGPILRLDYLWYRGAVRISHVEVHRNPLTDTASDHYPISGVLELA
jgi:endonuclease/exonuclease/phosphatase family metal-dependent hydrolase